MRSFYLIVMTLLLISLGLLDAVSTSSDLLTATPAMAKSADVDASNTDATNPISGFDGMR
jgi:hypothetical protein